MQSPDVLFYCNASNRVGFGHLRRCLFLANELADTTQRVEVAFAGSFDAAAEQLIRNEAPSASSRVEMDSVHARVSVIDYMFDETDMDAYDRSLIAEVGAHADETILLSSAATVPPDLPVDTVVGHLLEPTERDESFERLSGLAYAPVAPEVDAHRPSEPRSSEQVNRVFVGFGNVDNPTGVRLALRALDLVGYDAHVDLLLPPALLDWADEFEKDAGSYSLVVHHNIPSVPALLTRADCMIGSYGHMTFESLALGVPTLVIGLKAFMVDYADHLASQDVLVSVGAASSVSAEAVATELRALDARRRHALSANSLATVDGRGLQRIAREIRTRVRREGPGDAPPSPSETGVGSPGGDQAHER